jgi:hypothetical protein
MTAADLGPEPRTRAPRAVVARVASGHAPAVELRFTRAFTIGSSAAADIQLDEPGVAPSHAEVLPDGILWWIRDLSAVGTLVNGVRAQMVPLRDVAEVELGAGGPRVRLELVAADRAQPNLAQPERAQPERAPAPGSGTLALPRGAAPAPDPAPPPSATAAVPAPRHGPSKDDAEPPHGGFRTESQILRRFLRKDGAEPVGKETMLFRRAFEQVRRRSARPYQLVAAAVVVALVVAGGIIVHQQRKLRTLRETAERLFYATRAVEVEISQLEEVVLAQADRKMLSDLLARKAKVSQMEAEYDAFVKELGVYSSLPADEQVILRTARAFGECEVNVPPDFVAEVKKYVRRWKSSNLLATAMQRSQAKGYGPAIQRVLSETGLPPQLVYLPLVESGYDERAVGPMTRYGYAKGMWQFISSTADHFGLRVGPLHDQPIYDPKDERFEWQKATTAGARYIKTLSSHDAQASSLLVVACYNWGEGNVRGLLEKLPPTPQDRNFWRLLRNKQVPSETYDYVLSIFSAAVICEDPKLFGFDFTCPAMQEPQRADAPAAGG